MCVASARARASVMRISRSETRHRDLSAGEWNTALMTEAAALVADTIPKLSSPTDSGRSLDGQPGEGVPLFLGDTLSPDRLDCGDGTEVGGAPEPERRWCT